LNGKDKRDHKAIESAFADVCQYYFGCDAGGMVAPQQTTLAPLLAEYIANESASKAVRRKLATDLASVSLRTHKCFFEKI
jgi:hypothetical protein